jgi:hypothetical protein
MENAADHPDLKPEAIRVFTKAILRDLRALERMLNEGRIESGRRRFGAEQELFLVGDGWRPAPLSTAVLERLSGPPFTTELALFNLEINLAPIEVGEHCFTELKEALDRLIHQVRDAAWAEGSEAVLTGILPTLSKSDLTLEHITPKPRYHTLNEALTRMRGGEYHLRIEGTDELIVRHDSVMLEACNTSCQVHLQVSAEEFPRLYNTAQLALAPVLAASVNSPLLFGRRLWAETRIALFQQSIDTRSATPYVRDLSPRVRFGDRWVENSVTELFQEDLTRFRVLMAGPVDEDPLERLDAGEPPSLQALQFFNSTIYRWNRPCYGISQGKPHLRIECRALPSGPSVVDEVANAAFWIGLVLGIAESSGDPAEMMDFGEAKSNFLTAAREGLRSGLRWLDGETVSAAQLIRDGLGQRGPDILADFDLAREDGDLPVRTDVQPRADFVLHRFTAGDRSATVKRCERDQVTSQDGHRNAAPHEAEEVAAVEVESVRGRREQLVAVRLHRVRRKNVLAGLAPLVRHRDPRSARGVRTVSVRCYPRDACIALAAWRMASII